MNHAVQIEEVGGPEVMHYAPAPMGEPSAGQVRIRLSAAGVNFIDVYHRTGLYPRPLPFTPGLEGAGVVDAVGDGVTDLSPGDRVAWSGVPGSYADALIAPTEALVRVPEGLDDETAAALMLQGMTAHYLCRTTWPIQAGEVALVHAAAGGVGLLLIQLLRELGATVIGTCSTREKEALAREAGADEVIRYTEVDFAEATRAATGGRGVDVAYDSVGQSTFQGSLASLRPRGMLVLYGQSSGKVPPFDLAGLADHGSLFVTRPSLAHYNATREELETRAAYVLDRAADGRLNVRIGARFPLAEAGEAHAALEGRRTTGKVLLIP